MQTMVFCGKELLLGPLSGLNEPKSAHDFGHLSAVPLTEACSPTGPAIDTLQPGGPASYFLESFKPEN